MNAGEAGRLYADTQREEKEKAKTTVAVKFFMMNVVENILLYEGGPSARSYDC